MFAAILALWACEEKQPVPGTLAQVNGEAIHLKDVQALVDSRTSAMGLEPRPSVTELQKTYGQAAAILIVHALVRQELAARGLAVSDDELDETITAIKRDYGEDGAGQFLDETPLREDEWRELVRDHLSLRMFQDRILLPSIHVSLDEIRAAHEAHKEQLRQPELWNVCLKAAPEKAEVENWCTRPYPEIAGPENCISMSAREIPDPWGKELKKIAVPGCGRILEQEGQWRTVAVLGRTEARLPAMAEIYPLLERIVLEEKKNAAFETWLANKLAASTVRTLPGLFLPKNSQDTP